VPAVEHATKIAAAREAIGNADFFLVARTDARSVNGLKDAIARANLYHEVHTDSMAFETESFSAAYIFLVLLTLSDAHNFTHIDLQAGADGLFVEAPANTEELKQIAREVKGFKIANMIEGGKTPLHSRKEFREMGFHLVKHPLTSVFCTAKALTDVMNILKEKGTTREDLKKLATFPEFSELMNLESWYELESRLSSYSTEEACPKLGESAN